MEEQMPMAWQDGGAEATLAPFLTTVALMTSFRLNAAIAKFEDASRYILELHRKARTILAKVISYCPDTEEGNQRVLHFRRLLVLAAVLVKKHVRGEKELDEELYCELITEAEHKLLTKTVTTIASNPGGDNKKDKYPSKNRPSFCFQLLQKLSVELYRDGFVPSAPHAASLERSIEEMSNAFEEIEFLSLTLLPLPYAQLSRIICLLFLIAVALSASTALSWYTLILCFFVNLMYFSLDEVASQMELPFGLDENDVSGAGLCGLGG
eukprot:7376599-Prymnesium_polylepis.1